MHDRVELGRQDLVDTHNARVNACLEVFRHTEAGFHHLSNKRGNLSARLTTFPVILSDTGFVYNLVKKVTLPCFSRSRCLKLCVMRFACHGFIETTLQSHSWFFCELLLQ